MPNLILRGPIITLAQALKVAGLAQTGGQAKILIRQGLTKVNGEVVLQPAKKLVAGDRFRLSDGIEWTIEEQPPHA